MKVRPKGAAAGVGGAAATGFIWLLESFGVSAPAEVAGALATLLSFAGYLRLEHGR